MFSFVYQTNEIKSTESNLNCLGGGMALFYHSTYVIALLKEWANINYLSYLLTYCIKLKAL